MTSPSDSSSDHDAPRPPSPSPSPSPGVDQLRVEDRRVEHTEDVGVGVGVASKPTPPRPPYRLKKKSAPLPPANLAASLAARGVEECPKATCEGSAAAAAAAGPAADASVATVETPAEEPARRPTTPSPDSEPPVPSEPPAPLEPPASSDPPVTDPPTLEPPVPRLRPTSLPVPRPRPASSFLETLGIRSAGSVSAKSAPATPHSDWTPPVSPTPPRSPGGSASSRHDRQTDAHPRGGKTTPLSTSAPASAGAAGAAAAAAVGGGGGGGRGESPAGSVSPVPPPDTPTPDEPGSSKSRQKKFHRHFKQVAQEERVLNYYSCALVADILLQGQLYITKNYFAFYSNVFGYVTKLLIPTVSVIRISKEKTARIIPNAVGVVTAEDKHVFGSLLSRDATYRLMTQVWKTAMLPEPPAVELRGEEDDSVAMSTHEGYESSLSGSERSCSALTPAPSEAALHAVLTKVEGGVRTIPAGGASAGAGLGAEGGVARPPSRPSAALLAAGTALLVCLFLSAGFLLYRISLMQSRFNDNPLLSGSDHVYQEILKWQAQLHSRSANEVQDFLSSNLDQLAKVRQSLEALSALLLHNEASARTQRPDS